MKDNKSFGQLISYWTVFHNWFEAAAVHHIFFVMHVTYNNNK